MYLACVLLISGTCFVFATQLSRQVVKMLTKDDLWNVGGDDDTRDVRLGR